ncbi:hypothetical protein [Dickeya sp. NCPPB 3274]|uniref:hypothetical protein n=1 Tax=Dickeya sp. NCPPB 3274 TaxID=568766 RepID=UPI001268635D|nr:hypothetical protein [Dickeya sp. NCPPB 3274]
MSEWDGNQYHLKSVSLRYPPSKIYLPIVLKGISVFSAVMSVDDNGYACFNLDLDLARYISPEIFLNKTNFYVKNVSLLVSPATGKSNITMNIGDKNITLNFTDVRSAYIYAISIKYRTINFYKRLYAA